MGTKKEQDIKVIQILDGEAPSPYFDYVKLYFHIFKLSTILFSLIGAVLLAVAIILNIANNNYLYIILYVMVGVIIAALLLRSMYPAMVHYKQAKKPKNHTSIIFFEDKIRFKATKEVDNRQEIRETELFYSEIDRVKETKYSYYIFVGKAGMLISKNNNLNEEVIKIIEGFKKAK